MNMKSSRIYLFLVKILLGLTNCKGDLIINRAPHFLPQTGDLSNFNLPENTPVGTPVYQLKGSDPEKGKLHYSISGQYFTVDRTSGVIVLAKTLDREEQDTLEVIISITDEPISNTEPNTVSLRRVIKILDYNDNSPTFQNRPYRVNISEDFQVNAEIEVTPPIIITDRDDGINADIRVSCYKDGDIGDVEACSTFRLMTDKMATGKYQIRVYLKKQLDYEVRSSYIISLEAKDSSMKPLKSYASISVTVLDVQDQPPVFINGPYSSTVPENTNPNTHIMEIVAKDGDSVNPRNIQLSIEEDDLGYFKINANNKTGKGILVTSDIPLDRENPVVIQNGGVYNFKVKATELINDIKQSDSTVTQITIVVTDVDDHIPEFNKRIFDITVPEHIETGSPLPGLSIYVNDRDQGQNGRYDLRIRDVSNSEGVFVITPEKGEGQTPIRVKVKDSTKLDYDIDDEELRILSFDIIASVNEKDLSHTRVNIKLLDTNDNAPVFDKVLYKFNVSENAIIGYKFADITATDKDYGIFGEIEYSLTGFGGDYFRTDKHLGGLYVNRMLDYEEQKSFSLTLVAKDGGGRVTPVSVFVDVLDINDNAPIFDASDYMRTIREGATRFDPQLVINAIDQDGPFQGGGKITYSIVSDNSIGNTGNVFSIDEETGEILILTPLDSMDTPRGQYELTVRATDSGQPPLYNETKVFIRVGVPGNQKPTFKGNFINYKPQKMSNYSLDEIEMNPTSYKADIREDAKSGSNVTAVVANDPDGLDSLLRYHIVSGAKDNFVIDERLGIITVSSESHLDRETNADHYELRVIAVDKGTPIPETATTAVFVNIIDVNDEPPQFSMSETAVHISEHTKVGESIVKIKAIDRDMYPKLIYKILEPVKALDKSGVQLKPTSTYEFKSLFILNETTGELFVNSTLDYAQASIVVLRIKVQDMNAELNKDKQFDIMDLTVYIQPYNDKNPQFTNSGWSIGNPVIIQKVREEQPIGSTLLLLSADDPLSGHLVTNFKVINSETDFLKVDITTGQVLLTKRLDYENLTSPNLTLTVKAASNDGSKYSIAKILITVVNINDNEPTFEKALYKVSILESVKYPEKILTVKANDNDTILVEEDRVTGYSDVRYKLKGISSELFIIDEITGDIRVAPNKNLDREIQSVLSFEVIAYDTPMGGKDQMKTSTQVYIDVLDVNDNTPKFELASYTAVVPENVAVGSHVIKLDAFDPDEGLGGEIKFDLADEGDANGLFEINPHTGDIKTRSALTGRGRINPYRIVVRAQDGYDLYNDTILNLYIADLSANDGVPVFIKPEHDEVAFISENATIGSVVFQVVASDPDDPSHPAGKLYYLIQQNNPDAISFKIDPLSGLITTNKPLDREKKEVYNVVIQVSDRGDPPQSVSRILQINVTDVDDYKPRFMRNVDDPPIVFNTLEEIPIGSVIGKITATDEDIGANGAIDYSIIDGNKESLFALERLENNTALIKTSGRIDRETAAQYLLTIKSYKLSNTKLKLDKDYNRLDPSEMQVLVRVKDIDDHLPDFETAKIFMSVRLNVPIDTVVKTLKAIDLDPDSLPVEYKIVNIVFASQTKGHTNENVSDVFSLDSHSGELKTMKKLTHYVDGTFRLFIRAKNTEEVDRYTDVELEIGVVRTGDLLRLDWSGSSHKADKITQALREILEPYDVNIVTNPPTAAMRVDNTIDYSMTSLCFQLRSNGTALTPETSKVLLSNLKLQLEQVYTNYSTNSVTNCSGKVNMKLSVAPLILLCLAGLLVIAGIVAAFVLVCGKNRLKRHRSRLLLAREVPTSYIAGPVRMFTEPIYTTT